MNVEVSKCSSLFYVLVINTVKMCIRCQNAYVPLQRWSKSPALVETSATRLQHWEQQGRPALVLTSTYPLRYTCGASSVRVLQLTSVRAASRGEGDDRGVGPSTRAAFLLKFHNIGANPRGASSPVAFVLFPNKARCLSGRVFSSFFPELPLNSASTKRDNAAADAPADALNDGSDPLLFDLSP